jgi:hypothetical protein
VIVRVDQSRQDEAPFQIHDRFALGSFTRFAHGLNLAAANLDVEHC